MKNSIYTFILAPLAAGGVFAASIAVSSVTEQRAGGDLTGFVFDGEAFTQPDPSLVEGSELFEQFELGDELFEHEATLIKEEPEKLGGVGPLLNVGSCEGCHEADGRSLPEPGQGLLIRISKRSGDDHGGPVPHPAYGGQIADLANDGHTPEAEVVIDYAPVQGTYADGTPYELQRPSIRLEQLGYGPLGPDTLLSARAPQSVFGLGLLEAISEEQLAALEDPMDSDGDGISGRRNRVWDAELNREATGRFGWKAEAPTLRAQVAAAAVNDMGITNPGEASSSCTDAQTDCLLSDAWMEMNEHELDALTVYMALLSVPAQRNSDDPDVQAGQALFTKASCDSCHIPALTTGDDHQHASLRGQPINPFTDMLLHDMGPDLSDERPSFAAEGNEWRTQPLWGLGLVETVNGHLRLLHDGRARGIAEAILWHGGEAEDSKEAFRTMAASEREQLLSYLRSL